MKYKFKLLVFICCLYKQKVSLSLQTEWSRKTEVVLVTQQLCNFNKVYSVGSEQLNLARYGDLLHYKPEK